MTNPPIPARPPLTLSSYSYSQTFVDESESLTKSPFTDSHHRPQHSPAAMPTPHRIVHLHLLLVHHLSCKHPEATRPFELRPIHLNLKLPAITLSLLRLLQFVTNADAMNLQPNVFKKRHYNNCFHKHYKRYLYNKIDFRYGVYVVLLVIFIIYANAFIFIGVSKRTFVKGR